MQTETDAIPRRIVPFLSPTGLKGTLKALPLAEALQYLRRVQATGMFSVEKEGTRKTIYFLEGRIVFATSNVPTDRLGENLLRLGKIREDEYEQSLRQISHGKRHGRVLIEMGAIAPKDLWEGVEAQVREIVFSIFDWTSGDFVFEQNTVPEREKVTVSFDPMALLLEGLRHVDPDGEVKSRYPAPSLVLERTQAPPPAPLEPHEEHVLRLVDGIRPVEGICEESEIGHAQTLKVLYALFCIGLIRVRGRKIRAVEQLQSAKEGFDEILNPFNSMFAFVFRYLVREIGPSGEEQVALTVARLTARGGLLIACDVRKDGTLDPLPLKGLYLQIPEKERDTSLRTALGAVLNGLLTCVRESLGEDHESNVIRALRAGPSAP